MCQPGLSTQRGEGREREVDGKVGAEAEAMAVGALARLPTTGRGGQPGPDMGSTATLGPSRS